MIIGFEDNSKMSVACAVEALLLVIPDGPEHSLLYVAHNAGIPAKVHLTPAEFMTKVGAALEQMQGRAHLLGMAHGAGVPRQ